MIDRRTDSSRLVQVLRAGGSAGAMLVRRLVPVAVVMPIVLGWLRIKGDEAGFYSLHSGTAWLVSALIATLLASIWWTARSLDAADRGRQAAVTELAETERELRLVADNAPVYIAHCDADARFKFVNQRYAERLGLAPDDCVGKRIEDVLGAAAYETIRPYVDRVLTGTSVEFDVEVPYAIGGHFMHCSYAPELDDAGRVVGLVAAITDITDRRRAEQRLHESEAKFRLFIDHAPVAIAMFDRQMRYVAVSSRWLADYGLVDDVIGRSHYDVFGDAPERWREIHQRCLAGATEKADEDQFVRADGTVQWLRWEIRPWHDRTGAIGGIVIFSEDIGERKRAEQALATSERSFSTVFRAQPVAAVMSRLPGGEIVDVNDAFSVLTGFEHDEVIGRTSIEAGLKLDDAARRQMLADIDRAGGATNLEMTIFRKSGDARTATANVNVVELQGSRYLLSSLLDITDRRRAEAELAYQLELTRTITDNTQSCLLMVDSEGRGTFANPAAERITGFHASELIGHVVHDRIHHTRPDGTPFPASECPLHRAVNAHGAVVGHEDTFVHKDGHFYAVRCAARPIVKHGRPIGTVVEVQDITEERRLFAAERTARERAEEANRLKDDFLATLSHELRTPLNAILGWADMLQRHMLSPDRTARGLEVICNSARQQQALVEDLLDMSAIVSGRMRLDVRSVPLAPVIAAAVDTIRPSAEAKNIRVHVAADHSLGHYRCDPIRLQQVLWNVLSNAAKFTPAGGEIIVTAARAADTIRVAVRDSGIGIAKDFAPFLFDRFRQADSSPTRPYGGVGLGLSIASEIVTLHGGRIDVDSGGPHAGATFTIVLPLHGVMRADIDMPAASIVRGGAST